MVRRQDRPAPIGTPRPQLPGSPPSSAFTELQPALSPIYTALCVGCGWLLIGAAPSTLACPVSCGLPRWRLQAPDPSTVYPPGQLRASAHTDYGSLTILLPDTATAPGGLQVPSTTAHCGVGYGVGVVVVTVVCD